MKKIFILLSFMGLVTFSSLSAQTTENEEQLNQTEAVTEAAEPMVDSTKAVSQEKLAETSQEAVEEVAPTKTEPSFFSKLGSILMEIVMGLLLLVGPLAMIAHMIYVNWQTKMLKKTLTAEHFAAKRVKKGQSVAMTEYEKKLALHLLDEAYNGLTVFETNENGDEVRKPGKMKEVLRAQKKVEEVTKLMPTDSELLEHYNDNRVFLYDYLRRSFFASWKLIILCVIVAILVGFIGKSGNDSFWKTFFTMGAFFWVPAIVYYLSSQVPQYMIDRKNERNGGKGWFSTALVGLGLGVLGSGYTVRTKWSDGSVTEDNSSHFIALFLGIMVLIAVAMTIYIWAIINYLRNYVLYW